MGIISGAMQGLGEGLMKGADFYMKSILQEQAEKAIMARETTMQELRQAGAKELQVSSQEFTGGENTKNREQAVTLQDRGFEHSDTQQEHGFTHSKEMQGAQQAFQSEQNDAQRNLTREQIASNEKIAQANRQNALSIASMGGTVQQDKDGTVLFVDRNGNSKTVNDPRNPGQPLRGFKDLTPAAKVYADVIKAQLQGLDKEEVAALDDASRQKIVQRRAELNTNLLNVLTGGVDSATKSAASPYPDGTELKGKDGKIYVVRGGAPVLKESATAPASRSGVIGSAPAQTGLAQSAPTGTAEFDAMFSDAKRGGSTGKAYIQNLIDSGEPLSITQRQELRSAGFKL